MDKPPTGFCFNAGRRWENENAGILPLIEMGVFSNRRAKRAFRPLLAGADWFETSLMETKQPPNTGTLGEKTIFVRSLELRRKNHIHDCEHICGNAFENSFASEMHN